MTWLGLLAVCVCCATVGILADRWRGSVVRHRYVVDQQSERIALRESAQAEREANALRAIEERRLALELRRVEIEEQRLAVERDRSKPAPRPEPMPADLQARVASWQEDQWMQDQERATLLSLYGEYGDWDKVRQQLRPLTPVMETDIVAPRDGLYS